MSSSKRGWWLRAVAATVLGWAVAGWAEPAAIDADAERSFSDYEAAIHQVKIVNTHSQSQSAIGTGFFIDDGSLLATNYHVVSAVVLEPDQYSAVIEFNDKSVTLEVVALDVIHDLAILRVPVFGPALALSDSTPRRGARLFSIGNPLNIGMTLVEGNYNGLVDDRFFDQIHFSGAINAGMSGGPTLNQRGEVVGINVASAGNQVGFLVPVDKLQRLLAQVKAGVLEQQPDVTALQAGKSLSQGTPLQQEIGRQLQTATRTMIDRIMASDWPREALGDALVIGQMHPAVDCWGDSVEDTDKRLTTVQKGCNSRGGVYLSSSLRSAYIEYEFHYQQAEDWPAASLYNHASVMLNRFRPGNPAGKKDVDNYSCVDRVVVRDDGQLSRLAVYCTRPYIHYPGLFDTLYVGATLDRPDAILVEHFTLSGVAKTDGKRFLERFIEQVAWR